MYHQRSEKLKWVGIVILIGILGFVFWQNQRTKEEEKWVYLTEVIETDQSNQTGEDTSHSEYKDVRKIGVHVAGEVKNPGVYFLNEDSRVVDLIMLAGGVTKTADLNQINLAEPLMDGQKVIVPQRMTVVSTTTSGAGIYTFSSSSTTSSSSKKISINSASKEQLETISGVGPNKAEAIIRYREQNGRFRKLEDLKKVGGIGEKTFEKLKDQITL
ncbi:MAG: helix-hairpin-helix domain-containing protein [Halanaerobiales bacterium]|nr:helix-hairpin-helix domain-containing protein [Halanaerobiales bacterium]